MSQFIESICCEDGRPKLLDYHQNRLERTFSIFFPKDSSMDLNRIIMNIPVAGKYKCRLQYNADSFNIDYQPYQVKEINSLKIVHDDNIHYEFKSNNRGELDRLFHNRKEADDIIIIRNGQVTDSYYANLVFYDGRDWWTPQSPLLKGIKREFLLNKNLVKTRKIYEGDLKSFKKASLINAMLEIGEVEIPIDKILF